MRWPGARSTRRALPARSEGRHGATRCVLIAGAHDDGSVSSFAFDGTRSTVVAQFEGARFNSPNDLTVRDDGTVYFTDPNWQAPNPNPQSIQGVYRIDPSGAIDRFESSLGQPNGITLSVDQSVLYVGHAGGVMRYPDGMALDCAGNLYVTLHNDANRCVPLQRASDVRTRGTISFCRRRFEEHWTERGRNLATKLSDILEESAGPSEGEEHHQGHGQGNHRAKKQPRAKVDPDARENQGSVEPGGDDRHHPHVDHRSPLPLGRTQPQLHVDGSPNIAQRGARGLPRGDAETQLVV